MSFDDTVEIVRAGVKTLRAGDTVPDWSTATTTTQADVNVQPLTQAETVSVSRDVTVTAWRLLSRPGVDVDLLATDRVIHDGVTCEVVGEVGRWRVRGRVHHVEAVLQRAKG